jgi:chemotaxis protein methyltransferase CheR
VSTTPGNITPPASEITLQNYAFLQDHIYRRSGIVLDEDKHYLLQARLAPIVARRRMGSLNDLCVVLRTTGDAPLAREVVEALTTNETLFFRDVELWNGLQASLIPELVERHTATRILRCWSAASSSGQEPYSLAMLLLEMGLQDWHVQILATDLSEQVLARARAGVYSQLEVNRGLPARYLIKYFTRQGLSWQLKEEVRRMVRFVQADLRNVPNPLGPFDLVMCRNVLIYLDLDTRKKILRRIRGVLPHGGYLVLGSAETTLHIDDSFERRSLGRTTVYAAPK